MNDGSKLTLTVDARLINASGIGTVLQNVLPLLKDYFHLTLIGNRFEIERYEWAESIQTIHINYPIYSLKEQFLLPFHIPKTNYFLSPHYNIPLLPIRANQRLVIIHDVNHLALPQQNNFVKKAYAKFVINKAIKSSNKVLTVSEFSKKELFKYCKVKQKSIEVIPLGVNKKLFKKHELSELEAVKEQYKLPDSFLLYVGNVKPHKNLICLLRAFKQLLIGGQKDLKLVIVGKKQGFITEDHAIYNYIVKENLEEKIVFTGFIPNEQVPIIYNLATLFVFPSFYEGFGLPPIEAMACGCPTIVSNAASLPEICKEASVYFDPNDSFELARKINILLNNPDQRNKLIAKGNRLVQQYEWANTALHLKNLILS